MSNCLIINESQYRRIMEAVATDSENVINARVNIPIELEYTPHSNYRKDHRGLNDNLIIRHVRKVLPRIVQRVIDGKKPNQTKFTIINKNTCYIIPCQIELGNLGEVSKVAVLSAWKYDGKRSLDKLNSEVTEPEDIIYMGKPSKEWGEARRTELEYSGIEDQFNGEWLHDYRKEGKKIAQQRARGEEAHSLKAKQLKSRIQSDLTNWMPSKQKRAEMDSAWQEHEAQQAQTQPQETYPQADTRFLHRKDSLNRADMEGNTTKDQLKKVQMDKDWAEHQVPEKDYSGDVDRIISKNNDYLDGKLHNPKWLRDTKKEAWKQHKAEQQPSEDEKEMMANFDKEPMLKENTLIINEKQARSLKIDNCLNDILDETNYTHHDIDPEYQRSFDEWFNQYRGEDGKLDVDSIGEECLEQLKQTQFTMDAKHEFIKLPNGCKFHLFKQDIAEGNCDMYEIVFPNGEAMDGEILDPSLDTRIQKELAYHIIWR